MKPEQAATATSRDDTAGVWQWLLKQRNSSPGSPARPVCVTESQRALLDLYEPFAGGGGSDSVVVAHLGQSIDGFIATDDGDSYYVTGPQNLDHLHRMRALADAVVVGAGTVEADDPALTTRRVEGPNATRVILEGRRRIADSYGVFTDGDVATLLVRAGPPAAGLQQHGNAEVIQLPSEGHWVEPRSLLDALALRGMKRVFIEGGGKVVSTFLASGVLDRLQLAIAPILIGQGRRGIVAPAQARLLDCLRPAHRLFSMGEELLFDYDLRAAKSANADAGGALRRLR